MTVFFVASPLALLPQLYQHGGRTVAVLRVGVIGCGAIAQACHLPGYQKNPNAEVVAVADPVPERLAEAQARFKISHAYSNAMDLLAHSELDAVSVCLPHCHHAAIVSEAVKRRLHVFLEQPIATTLQEGLAVAKAVQMAGTVCMVNFTHRFYDGIIAAKAALERGELGAIAAFRIRLSSRGPRGGGAKSGWYYDRGQAGGGVLMDWGSHALDLVQHLLGPITAVQCRMVAMTQESAVEDTAALLVDAGDRRLGLVDVAWTTEACFTGVELYGLDGSMIVDYARGVRVSRRMVGGGEWRRLDVEPQGGGWNRALDTFVVQARRGEPFRDGAAPTIAAGLSCLRAVLAAYESARTGRRMAC